MSHSPLSERASLEYLKKLAKERLQELRQTDPQTKLAAALLAVARDHGFSSWRALKAKIEQRQTRNAAVFFDACAKGDVETLRTMLANDPGLVRASKPDARHTGWTGLHTAARAGHVDAVRLLLAHGGDPNAREQGDNTSALHWAAAHGHIETVRVLLDAGGDVHGVGDVHELDVIGWAGGNQDVVALLLERGARHHIFSAITTGDLQTIQTLVEQNPEALDRRMSRFEQGQTPLHFAISKKRYDILDLLIELGADLEAPDKNGQTALAVATMRRDREAMSRLQTAGAKPPQPTEPPRVSMAEMFASVRKIVPMIMVPDVAQALAWYVSIGFKELARYEDDGLVNFGMMSFGKAEIMLNMHGKTGAHDVTLWLYTDQVDNLYRLFKSRQDEIEFVEDINDAFYGAREFAIRDLNGYELYFIQPAES